MHFVLLRVDSHGANSQLCARSEHSNGDFSCASKPNDRDDDHSWNNSKRHTSVGAENTSDGPVLDVGGVEPLQGLVADREQQPASQR